MKANDIFTMDFSLNATQMAENLRATQQFARLWTGFLASRLDQNRGNSGE